MYTTLKWLDPLDNHMSSIPINRGIAGFFRQPAISLGIVGSAIFLLSLLLSFAT